MIDPALLQTLANRLAGLSTNGHTATDFPEPLATLWRDLDTDTTGNMTNVFIQWAGVDTARQDIINDIFKLCPGGQTSPDPWRIFSLTDAYKPRPPLQFIVDGVLIVPSLVIVYGSPGGFKSMLVADLMTCVAAGEDWLIPKDPKTDTARATTQVGTLWCDFDNGNRRTHERFEALARVRNLPESTPLYYVSMPDPWLDANDKSAIGELVQRIRKLNVQLVVIDNLGTITGKADENSAEMVQVMSNLRYVAETTQSCVIVLHHQRKGSGVQSRSGEMLRGHSSIEAALDLALLVEREEYSDDVLVKSTKTRDVDVHPFGATFDYSHKTGTKELDTAQFWGIVVEDKTSKSALKNAVIDVVTNNPMINQKDLVTAVRKDLPDIGINRIQTMIGNLVKLGLLCTRPGPRTSILYTII